MEIIIELIIAIVEICFWASGATAFERASAKRNLKITFLFLLCIVFGILSGFISYVIFPFHFIANPNLQLANLFLSPLIAGYLGGTIAYRNSKKKKEDNAIIHFLAVFAFAFLALLTRTVGLSYNLV